MVSSLGAVLLWAVPALSQLLPPANGPFVACTSTNHCTVSFSPGPKVVRGGSEAFVLHEEYFIKLGAQTQIRKIRTFVGLDRGDVGEFDIEVETPKGFRLVTRSLHKEDYATYDAWKTEWIDEGITTNAVRLKTTARVTGRNVENNNLSARVHFGLIVEGIR